MMGPHAIQSESPVVFGAAARAGEASLGGFSRALSRAAAGEAQATGAIEDAASAVTPEGREAAEQLLSTAFIAPVLKQLREMNDAPAPWAPTEAEKQFGPLLDQRLADEMVKAAQWPIVDRLARDLSRGGGGTREVRDGVDRIA